MERPWLIDSMSSAVAIRFKSPFAPLKSVETPMVSEIAQEYIVKEGFCMLADLTLILAVPSMRVMSDMLNSMI